MCSCMWSAFSCKAQCFTTQPPCNNFCAEIIPFSLISATASKILLPSHISFVHALFHCIHVRLRYKIINDSWNATWIFNTSCYLFCYYRCIPISFCGNNTIVDHCNSSCFISAGLVFALFDNIHQRSCIISFLVLEVVSKKQSPTSNAILYSKCAIQKK